MAIGNTSLMLLSINYKLSYSECWNKDLLRIAMASCIKYTCLPIIEISIYFRCDIKSLTAI